MKLKHFSFAVLGVTFVLAGGASACDLCSIYGAADARGENGTGFLVTVAEQFTPLDTVQLNGQKITGANQDYLDRSITHFVAAYNFSPWFGVNLNVPLEYRSFRRTDLRYSLTAPPVSVTETGSETDLGDVAMIARLAVIRQNKMNYGVVVNILGGVKLPTGNTSRIDDEVEQSRIFQQFLPPGTPHDPLSHSQASLHEHELSPGSGSCDGIFGATINSRWHRFFFNGQFQYYLRTPGASGFQFGDETIVSGGPGAYLLLMNTYTLSLQANATYDTMSRDKLIGTLSDLTGETSWYVGPALSLTAGSHFSANLGVDLPLRIANRGRQNVADYILRAGVNWRF